jgi:hypothetical protein
VLRPTAALPSTSACSPATAKPYLPSAPARAYERLMAAERRTPGRATSAP